jgi:uncharacterized membrane protein YhaH (DUF805 family)
VLGWLGEQGWGEARATSLIGEVAVEWENKEPTRLTAYFGFHGRIGLGRFWLGNLIKWVIWVAAAGLTEEAGLQWVFPPALLVIVLLDASSGVRRLHDRGHSGWLALVAFISILGWYWSIPMAFMSGDKGANALWGRARE